MHLDAVQGTSEDFFRRTYLYVEKEPQRSNTAMRQMHKLYKWGCQASTLVL